MCLTYNPLIHETFMCVTLNIHVCDSEHSCVWNWTFMCVTLNIHVCDIQHSCVWHCTFMCVTLNIHVCDIEHSCVWHWTFIRCHDSMPRLIHMCAGTHSHVCRDSFVWMSLWRCVLQHVAACCSVLQCVAVPRIMCDMTRSCVGHESLGVTWRIPHMIPWVWLDAFFKCVTSLDAFLKCAASLDAFLNVWHMTRCIPQECHQCIPQACHMCHTLLVLQCIVACCSVVRCVAMCCGVLQCVAVCCSAMHNVCPHSCVCGQHMVSCGAHMVSHIVWHILSYPSVSPCICCMRCSVLQCVAVPHMVSHSCVIPCLWSTYVNWCIDSNMPHVPRMMYVAVCCSVLQCVAVCRSTLPCVVMRRKCVTSLMYVRGILNSYTLACVAQGHMSWLIVYVCDMTHTWLDMTHTYVWPHSMKCGCNPPFVA